ncbi:MAG: hypothetical protein FWC97_09280 [Treponema sp.]|nr:hypothetical protein [Treponema sp.]
MKKALKSIIALTLSMVMVTSSSYNVYAGEKFDYLPDGEYIEIVPYAQTFITRNNVRLHGSPGGGMFMGWLNYGDLVNVQHQNGMWLYVRVLRSRLSPQIVGYRGYISIEYTWR